MTIKAFAVSLEPGLRVFFGDRTATEVSAVINSPWVVITCLPPPFPGGKHPLPVDVRVVNADGSEGKSESAFTYQTIVPEVLEINGGTLPPWKSGLGMDFYIEARLIDGSGYKVYFNGILGADTQTYISRGVKYLYTKAPAFPPGTADLTVVNGDGGVFFKSDAIVISGTPSTDFHPGDRDRDFRFNLSEVLRVVQFYNSGGLHCDPTSEDGYAPGVGSDTSCTPYPADNAPFDWNLGLTELLGIIQFYNLHCYQPCPAAPGTYCPPD
jgi:hypothetical protein